MTETETEPEVPAAAEPEPAHPYTEAALARIMLCDAYRQVAEAALARIPTDCDGSDLTGSGDAVRAAASLLARAEDVMRRAAVYERERGTSWEEIGDALGITKQSAHKRFAGAAETWRAPFDQPARLLPDGTPDDERIPYGARYAPSVPKPHYGTAEDQAHRLEQWLLQHTGPTDHWHADKHPVTGGLPRHSTTAMLMLTDRVSHRLLHDQLVPDPQAQADLADRRVALYERLIREGDAPPEATQWIAKDRARAAALRATPGTGTPWPTDENPTEAHR
ncbi:hypothetical protein ACH5A3_39670 [Streptomyces echinatus]|uniref:hypothetical protein n=1 Tax=Streptomyces echinatus TaxID=67293 RepID=UPI0037A608EF